MTELHTTLKALRDHSACKAGYVKCKEALGAGWGDDTPIPLSRILASNGIADVIWCFRALLDGPGWTREYIPDCAEHVLPIWESKHPEDTRPRRAIEVVRLFLQGKATQQEVRDAAYAAYDAATAYAAYVAYAAYAATDAYTYAAFATDAADAYAAHAYAYATERRWQAERMLWYVNGEQSPSGGSRSA